MEPRLSRVSVVVPMDAVEHLMDCSAEFVAAGTLDDGASFIRMRLLGLSVFGFPDPFAL